MNKSDQTDSDDVTRVEPGAVPRGSAPAGDGVRDTGAQLGEFRLQRRLGRGGMAEVWLAEQTSLKRNVALKLLRSELMEDETYVQRFQTEAKAAAGLNHPNIVQVYTVGAEKGQHFIAQEYVHGKTLKSLLKRRGPLELNVALPIMRQVAAALEAAAEKGIVHRDIKPENIMLTRKGEAKVADFGLAQLQGGERLNLTQEGMTMGTPLYMSPEQVSGQKLDHRSDIYSFGVTCYHMLAGRPPFEGDNAVSIAVKHLHEAPVPLEEVRPDLPGAVCEMVQRMMAKQSDDRYASAQELLADVRRIAKALKTGESLDQLKLSGKTGSSSLPLRHPVLTLITLCLLVAMISGTMGWMFRPRIPPSDAHAIGSAVPRMESARQQYVHAMFQMDNEDAFKAVIEWFPGDVLWTRLAHEQLALYYLKDSTRTSDALRELRFLQSLREENPRYYAVGRIGEAYLAAKAGDSRKAETILRSSSQEFARHLSGSWRQIEEDVRDLVEAANES
jgi:eukaryotic-like serine/threonine-protein kinase